MNCVFCKIVAGEIPSTKLYETQDVLAFADIAPAAPFHAVIIPKAHSLESAAEVTAQNSAIIAKIFEAAAVIAKENGLDQDGFRVVTNCGEYAGQTVQHIHFHLMGGGLLGKMASDCM